MVAGSRSWSFVVGRAWSCVVLRGLAWSCVVVRGRAWSCVVVRGRAWSCVVVRLLDRPVQNVLDLVARYLQCACAKSMMPCDIRMRCAMLGCDAMMLCNMEHHILTSRIAS